MDIGLDENTLVHFHVLVSSISPLLDVLGMNEGVVHYVEDFDEFEDAYLCSFSGFEVVTVYHDRTKETLCKGIIPAIAFWAHDLFADSSPKQLAEILRSAVRVNDGRAF